MTATAARAKAVGGAGSTGRPAGAEVNAREPLVQLCRDLRISSNGSTVAGLP